MKDSLGKVTVDSEEKGKDGTKDNKEDDFDVDELFGFSEWDQKEEAQTKASEPNVEETRGKETPKEKAKEEDGDVNLEDLFEYKDDFEETNEAPNNVVETVNEEEPKPIDENQISQDSNVNQEVKEDETNDKGKEEDPFWEEVGEVDEKILAAIKEDAAEVKHESINLTKVGDREYEVDTAMEIETHMPYNEEIIDKEQHFVAKLLTPQEEKVLQKKPLADGEIIPLVPKSEVFAEPKDKSPERPSVLKKRVLKIDDEDGDSAEKNEKTNDKSPNRRKKVTFAVSQDSKAQGNSAKKSSEDKNKQGNNENSWFHRLLNTQEAVKDKIEPENTEIVTEKEPNLDDDDDEVYYEGIVTSKSQPAEEGSQEIMATKPLPDDFFDMDFDEEKLVNEMKELEDTDNTSKVRNSKCISC